MHVIICCSGPRLFCCPRPIKCEYGLGVSGVWVSCIAGGTCPNCRRPALSSCGRQWPPQRWGLRSGWCGLSTLSARGLGRVSPGQDFRPPNGSPRRGEILETKGQTGPFMPSFRPTLDGHLRGRALGEAKINRKQEKREGGREGRRGANVLQAPGGNVWAPTGSHCSCGFGLPVCLRFCHHCSPVLAATPATCHSDLPGGAGAVFEAWASIIRRVRTARHPSSKQRRALGTGWFLCCFQLLLSSPGSWETPISSNEPSSGFRKCRR